MPQEIEVKYLVKQLPALYQTNRSEKIRQGYIVAGGEEHVVRLRQKGDRFFLTVKGRGLLSRNEVEVELSHEQFDKLWQLTEGKRVEKVRYFIDYTPHTIELDIFEGDLLSLIVAEVEFTSEDEVKKFTPPDWFGKEVTKDSRYQNSNLSIHGLPLG